MTDDHPLAFDENSNTFFDAYIAFAHVLLHVNDARKTINHEKIKYMLTSACDWRVCHVLCTLVWHVQASGMGIQLTPASFILLTISGSKWTMVT